MNRLLQRLIKRSFGKDFDLDSLPIEVKNFINSVEKTYETYDKDKKLLENVVTLNSDELNNANELIRNKSLETDYVLGQYKDVIDRTLIVSKTDSSGKIIYANKNFCTISGYSEKELLGQNHNIVNDPNVDKSLFKDLWQTITNKQIWQGTFSNINKDGSIYYVETTITPILNTQGSIVEYMALRKDVTERILLEEKSKYLHKRLQLIMDTQESLIVIIDKELGVVEVNQYFYDITGFHSFEEFREKHECICELFIEKDSYIKPSSDGFHWTDPLIVEPDNIHKALMKDVHGVEIIYSVRVREIELDNKTYSLATFVDITNIESMRQAAQNAEKAKSEFLANMSHEIRTPLNAILGFVDLIKEESKEDKTLKYINIIDKSSQSLLKIIEDVLDFSKIESGKLDMNFIDFNTKEELESIGYLFQAKCSQSNITLTTHFDDNIPEAIHTDPFRIKQVMTNLLSNAVKFTPAHKKIDIAINFHDNYLYISVKDEGKGIAEDRIDSIFEAFKQEDASTTRQYGGTGLGLTISNELVQLLGGTLKVESTLGVGSEFSFMIPVKVVKKVSNSQKILKHIDYSDKKVLFVEDIPTNQVFMKIILKKMHLEFDLANDGLEALEAFKNNKYDVILMDENMPKMGGIEATREILKLEKELNLVHTPIIALTANALKGDRERFIKAGMDEYLSKPVNRNRLINIFDIVLK